MAVIFSLPWALLMWSYVIPNLPRHYFQLIPGIPPRTADRMVIFFIALMLFCFTISNFSTPISVSVSSVMMALLVVGCILASWRTTSDDRGLWWQNSPVTVLKRSRDGLSAAIITVITYITSSLLSPLRLRSAAHNHNVGSTHAMTERQDGVGV
jgi:hypothetical protein